MVGYLNRVGYHSRMGEGVFRLIAPTNMFGYPPTLSYLWPMVH